MSSVRNLTFKFISPTLDFNGDDLQFISTTDVQIPKGSEIALQACQFSQVDQPPLIGDISYRYENPNTNTLIEFFSSFPSGTNALSSAASELPALLSFLNSRYNANIVALLSGSSAAKVNEVFTAILGSAFEFDQKNGFLRMISSQFYQRGVGSILNEPTQTDLAATNVISNGTETDIIDLENPATGDGFVQAIVPMVTDPVNGCALARFCPGDDVATTSFNGSCNLQLFTTATPTPQDIPVVTIQHAYRASAADVGVRQNTPVVRIRVRGAKTLIKPTLNGTMYEIRKYGSKLQIELNPTVASMQAPPTDPAGNPVEWGNLILLSLNLNMPAEQNLFPRWVMTRGGGTPTTSKKRITECFYVAESLYDASTALAYAPDNFVAEPIFQEINQLGQIGRVTLSCSEPFSTQVLGLEPRLGGNAVDIGEAGYEFAEVAAKQFGTLQTPLPSTAISILEPFRISGLTIFNPGSGNSVPSSILALFNSETVHLSSSGDIVFSTDNPLFYPIESRGTINARNFKFAITTGDGGTIALQKVITVSVLIRSPTTVLGVL